MLQTFADERLFNWHAAMFPTGRSGMHKIVVGDYRDNSKEDPIQVMSGPMGREKVHFQAPDSELLREEMSELIGWFNNVQSGTVAWFGFNNEAKLKTDPC
ncbi:hypothetical protein ACX0G9_20270 [Flavitalea flava]